MRYTRTKADKRLQIIVDQGLQRIDKIFDQCIEDLDGLKVKSKIGMSSKGCLANTKVTPDEYIARQRGIGLLV